MVPVGSALIHPKIWRLLTPSDAIMRSSAWGGRASDQHMSRESGFLDLLEPTDLIMADRDFTIKEDLTVGGLHWKSHHHVFNKLYLPSWLTNYNNVVTGPAWPQHAVGLEPSPNVRYDITPLLTDSSTAKWHKKQNLNTKAVSILSPSWSGNSYLTSAL